MALVENRLSKPIQAHVSLIKFTGPGVDLMTFLGPVRLKGRAYPPRSGKRFALWLSHWIRARRLSALAAILQVGIRWPEEKGHVKGWLVDDITKSKKTRGLDFLVCEVTHFWLNQLESSLCILQLPYLYALMDSLQFSMGHLLRTLLDITSVILVFHGHSTL